jgi:uncharacterized protein
MNPLPYKFIEQWLATAAALFHHALEARMSPNKATVQRYMEAYSKWDHPAVLACLTEDVEWVVPGAFHLVGREAFDNEIEGRGAAGPPDIVVTRLIQENEVVMAEGTVRSALEDGGIVSLVFCDVFLMRDGLIQRLTSYLMAVPDLDQCTHNRS